MPVSKYGLILCSSSVIKYSRLLIPIHNQILLIHTSKHPAESWTCGRQFHSVSECSRCLTTLAPAN